MPAFQRLHPHAQALAAGVRVAGAGVHFVSEDMDAWPIIVQGAALCYSVITRRIACPVCPTGDSAKIR